MAATTLDTARVQVPHLPAATLARLHARLTEDRQAGQSLVASHSSEEASRRGDGDRDGVDQKRQFADFSVALAREALTEIDDALGRIDAGTYGVCESCGAAVPVERLEVIPETRYCVRCAGRQKSLLQVAR